MERLALEAQQREQQRVQDSPAGDRPEFEKFKTERHGKAPKSKSLNSSIEKDDKKSKKKQKLYCVCQMPYDKTRYDY